MLFTHTTVINMAVDDQVSQGGLEELLRKLQGCYVREESEAMEKVARTVARYFRPLAAVKQKNTSRSHWPAVASYISER